MTNIKILIFSQHYLPGYKAGGPIQTLANIVTHMGEEFDFRIVTNDRDLGDSWPYADIDTNQWNQVGKSEVLYVSPDKISFGNIKNIINKTPRQMLYLNSFFSYSYTIKPLILRRLGLLPTIPVILAPRGEFSQGAINIKAFKKKIFLLLAKITGLYDNIIWQASSEYEARDIRRYLGDKIKIIIAPDLHPPAKDLILHHPIKTPGKLKIIFLSRISRMKNLAFALQILKDLTGEIEFNIYGPMEDESYWEECQQIIQKLPHNIQINYHGSIPHDKIINIFSQHHLFLFPTLGENFGHVILEAFIAGCPVVVSEQTPWRNLYEKGIGEDISLDTPDLFAEAVQKYIDMDDIIYKKICKSAEKFGYTHSNDQEIINKTRNLFNEAK